MKYKSLRLKSKGESDVVLSFNTCNDCAMDDIFLWQNNKNDKNNPDAINIHSKKNIEKLAAWVNNLLKNYNKYSGK